MDVNYVLLVYNKDKLLEIKSKIEDSISHSMEIKIILFKCYCLCVHPFNSNLKRTRTRTLYTLKNKKVKTIPNYF